MKAFKIFICFLIALLFIITFGVVSTSAEEEKYKPTIKSYDGVDYAGYLLDSSNVKTFETKLDLTDSDLETPIFQFVITPSKRGNGVSYTPDFENLVFTLSDTKGRVMTISFSPRTADAPKYRYLNAFAKGENQDLLGEHQGNYEYAGDPNEGTYLSDTYPAISPYTFDGFGADSSWRHFYDKNGGTFTEGCNGLVSIYYSIEENALYADTGYEWVNDDTSEGKEWTLTDKFTLAKSGERRYRIRDFDKDDYIQGNPSNVLKTIWPGFEDLSNITMNVSFAKLVTNTPSILLVSVNGKSIVDNYYLENHTKAIKSVAFPVPKPLFLSEGRSYDFTTYGGKVKITNSTGDTVLSKRNYTNGMTFTPSSAGNYSIEYFMIDPVYSVERTYTYSFETLEDGGTTLRPNGYDRSYLVNETINAGCYISNNVQDYLPTISLTITKEDSELYSTDDLNNLIYKFESEGTYTFTYSSTDLLGRETTITKNYIVGEYYLKIKDGLSESVVLSDYKDVVKPVNSDYTIVNIVSGKTMTATGISIKLSRNGGEYSTYTKNNSIDGEGNFTVKYTYTFSGGTLEAYRKFTVYSDLPTISINSIPTNTVLAANSSLNDNSVYVIALKGSTINIPSNLFESESTLSINVYDGDGTLTDSTELYNSGGLSIALTEIKNYAVKATIVTDNGLVVSKNIFFIVKDGVLNIAPVSDQSANVGHEISLVVPDVTDINGEKVTGGSISISYNDDVISSTNGKFTPNNVGVYYVTYSITLSGHTESSEYRYIIYDDEAPVITLKNESVNAKVGEFTLLDNYEIKDNSSLDYSVNTTVTFNGKEVFVYNNGFDAEKEGTYEVLVSATDIFGNTSTKTYNISTTKNNNNTDNKDDKKGCNSSMSAYSILIMIITLLILSFIAFNKKTRRYSYEKNN